MSRRAPVPLAALTPWGQLRAGRRPRRLVQLVAGLTLYGVSVAMMVRGGLGLPPWDVLTVGLVKHLPMSFGQVVIATSFVVLLLWVPLRQLPGLGTLLNAVLIGLVADATLARLPHRTRGPRGRRCWSAGSCSTAWPGRCTSAPSSGRVRATG